MPGRESILFGRDHQAHALVTGISLGIGFYKQRKTGAVNTVRDPGLGAVDHIIVTVAHGDGLDSLQIGAGIRLG